MSEDASLNEFIEEEKHDSSLKLGPLEIDIPDEWDSRELSDVFKLVTGNNYTGDYLSDEDNGGRVFLTLKSIKKGGGFNWDSIKYYTGDINDRELVEAGDLLIANTDVTQGGDVVGYSTRVPDFDSDREIAASMDLSILRPRSKDVNIPYSEYLLQTDYSHSRMRAFSAGSTVLHLNKDLVKSLSLPIPPLEEQRKIASVLYTVDQAIQKTEEVIEQTKRIKTGVIQSLFRHGTEAHDCYQETGSGVYPEDWNINKFENLIEDTRYGTDNKSNSKGEGYPTLRIPNVVEKRITTDDLKHTPLDDDELGRLRLRNDDILVIRTNGNPNYVGRCATFSERNEPFVFASYLIRIRVDESRIQPAFVREFLNSQRGRSEMSGWIRSSAGNYNLSVGAIEKFDVPVPSLDEQDAIVKKIDSVKETIRVNDRHLGRLQRLKQGLIQDLLSGEVRTHDKHVALVEDVLKHG